MKAHELLIDLAIGFGVGANVHSWFRGAVWIQNDGGKQSVYVELPHDIQIDYAAVVPPHIRLGTSSITLQVTP